MWYIHTTEYSSAIKKNGVLIHVTIWMNLEIVTVEETSYKGSYMVEFCLYEISRKGKATETDSGLFSRAGEEVKRSGSEE